MYERKFESDVELIDFTRMSNRCWS